MPYAGRVHNGKPDGGTRIKLYTMNVLSTYLKRIGRTWLAAALCCAFMACDGVIYDDEGDCSVTYRVEFRYVKNMKWADAFAHEVKSVHLYAFDTEGLLVWQRSEKGGALAQEGYAMTLDLPAGDYRLLAWCGLENDGRRAESFSVPEAEVGRTHIEELQCRLNRTSAAGAASCSEELYPLYHGLLDVTLPASDDKADYLYTMELTKDTNHVRIILQHLSGEAVNVDDFTFRIEDANGLMNYDNALLPDEKIIYQAYHTGSGTASMGFDDYNEPGKSPKNTSGRKAAAAGITSVSVAIADLSIARLMEDRDAILVIETAGGENVARIPLTDYALLLGTDQTDGQDFLDRQDEWALTFFLDSRDRWIETSIIINSWKLVLDKVDFGQ